MTERPGGTRTRFSTDGLPGHRGWEAWRNMLTPLFDIQSSGEPDAFHAELDGFDLGSLFVAKIGFGGVRQRGFRSKPLINRSGLDHYGVELCVKTDGYVCESGNGAIEVDVGDIVVLDLSQANVMTSTNSTSLTLTVPRAILDRHCPGVENLHGTRLSGTGRCGLLGDHLLSLYRRLPHLNPAEAEATADATIRLLGACLAPSAERFHRAGTVIDRTLLARATRYIDDRLDDPHLTPAAVCAELGLSRTNLYRLFQGTGGVSRCIQERRLLRAHAAGRDPARRRSISEVAYACGFGSAAHFSRAFRKRFDCAPSDVRDLAKEPAPRPASADAFAGAWLNRTRGRTGLPD